MPVPFKLTKEQKSKIIKLNTEEKLEPKILAERFGVAPSTIHHVLATHRKEQKHHGVRHTDKGTV